MSFNRFPNGTIVETHKGWVEITLPDGRKFQALPEDDPSYEARAYALGFTTTWDLCRYHDFTHAILADWLGMDCSPALLAACGKCDATDITDAEEHVVMALHRYINLLRNAGTKTTFPTPSP